MSDEKGKPESSRTEDAEHQDPSRGEGRREKTGDTEPSERGEKGSGPDVPSGSGENNGGTPSQEPGDGSGTRSSSASGRRSSGGDGARSSEGARDDPDADEPHGRADPEEEPDVGLGGGPERDPDI